MSIKQAIEAPLPNDTPRRRMANLLFAAWAEAEPTHNVTKYPESYLATFLDMADAAVAALRSMPAEPVGRFTEDGTLTGGVEWIPYSGPQLKTGDLLYATPPPAPVLSDEKIMRFMAPWHTPGDEQDRADLIACVRSLFTSGGTQP